MEIPILINVMKKQNNTNFVFQTLEKSDLAISRNRRAGSAALNTNLFSLLTNASSKSLIFRKNSPRRRVRKMGIVAFRQKTRFSIKKKSSFN